VHFYFPAHFTPAASQGQASNPVPDSWGLFAAGKKGLPQRQVMGESDF